MTRQPTPKKPVLVWCAHEEMDRLTELTLARVGGPESPHPLNGTQRVDMAHAVIACGRCGGVSGGDGIKVRDGAVVGRCPTKRCVCKRRTA